MNVILAYAVAIVAGLCGSSAAPAEYVFANAPTKELAPEDADLIDRGTNALSNYLVACLHRDLTELKKVVTDDAVLEFPLKKWGTYLSVYPKMADSYCGIASGKKDIAELFVYPTNTAGVLLVNYSLRALPHAKAEQPTEHLALLEMRQEKICRIRDFSATSHDPRWLLAHSGAK